MVRLYQVINDVGIGVGKPIVGILVGELETMINDVGIGVGLPGRYVGTEVGSGVGLPGR